MQTIPDPVNSIQQPAGRDLLFFFLKAILEPNKIKVESLREPHVDFIIFPKSIKEESRFKTVEEAMLALSNRLLLGKERAVYFVFNQPADENRPYMRLRNRGIVEVLKQTWQPFRPDESDFFFVTTNGRLVYVPLSLVVNPNARRYLEQKKESMPQISIGEILYLGPLD